MKSGFLALLLGLSWSGLALAQGGFDEGFDMNIASPEAPTEATSAEPEAEADLPKAWDFYGFAKTDFGYSYEKQDPEKPLSKLRETLNLTFDYKFSDSWRTRINGNAFYDGAYGINGTDLYTQEVLDAYQQEVELRDTYLEGELGAGFSIKMGRQVIAWGQSDASQINDMANPRDNREMGMVDLEDARIPVIASMLSLDQGSWRTDLVAIHEFRANKTAPVGSEFDPLIGLRTTGVTVGDEQKPNSGGEWAARALALFNGGDLGFYASHTYNDQFYLGFDSLSLATGSPQLTLAPQYAWVDSVGVAGNKVLGSLLIKGEYAQKKGLRVNRADVGTQAVALIQSGRYPANLTWGPSSEAIQAWAERDQEQYMFGVEYMGVTDLVLTLEADYTHIKNWDETISSKENQFLAFSTLSYSAINDRLNSRLVWIQFVNGDGGVYRYSLDYDWLEGLNIAGGLVVFRSPGPDALIEAYKNNDRFTLAAKYSF